MDERMETVGPEIKRRARVRSTLSLVVIGLCLTACGPRRLNVVHTTQQTLLSVGYSADRSRSIFRADNEAQEYCERQRQGVLQLKQETVYQGHYDQEVTEAGRTVGRVADAVGSPRAAQASRALSSPTDYKTSLEFLCQ